MRDEQRSAKRMAGTREGDLLEAAQQQTRFVASGPHGVASRMVDMGYRTMLSSPVAAYFLESADLRRRRLARLSSSRRSIGEMCDKGPVRRCMANSWTSDPLDRQQVSESLGR